MRRLFIILALLLFAQPAMAAFTPGNHDSIATNNNANATLNVNTTGAQAVVFQIVYYRDPTNQNSCINAGNQRVPMRPRDTLNSDDSWAALGEVRDPVSGISMSTWIGSGSGFNFGSDTFRIADTMYDCWASFSVSAWNADAVSPTPGIPQVGLPQGNTATAASSIQAGANNGGELVLTFLGTAVGNCSGDCGYAVDSGFTMHEVMNESYASQGGAMAYRINAPATNPTWTWARPPGTVVAMNVTLREVFATAGTLDVIAATSCELADIQQDLSYLVDAGTLNVPAGSCTWPSGLLISRGVTMLSPSAGTNAARATQITIADPSFGIRITPSNSGSTFKIDGFSFDGQDQTVTMLHVPGGGKVNLIITHNTFKNGNPNGDGITTGGAILTQGNEARGVIANNIFDRVNKVAQIFGVNYPSPFWTPGVQPTLLFGGSDQLFFETNTIKYSSSYISGAASYAWFETAQGGRAVIRFNEYDFSNVNSVWEAWDQHGWQSWLPYDWTGSRPSGCATPTGCVGQTGTTLYENYDNHIVSGQMLGRLTIHRGSKGIFFDNTYKGSTAGSVNWNVQQYAGGCSAAMLGMSGLPTSLPFDFIPEINDNYYFHNIAGPGSLNREIPVVYTPGGGSEVFQNGADGGGPNAPCGPVENGGPPTGLNAYPRGYWQYSASFNGTGGVGRGPGSPATAGTYPGAPNCTMGVGWWRTDAGNWRTDPDHKPNGDGEFWKCVTTNTWQLYYTPYTYPHPLVVNATPPATTLTVGNHTSTQSYAALHVPSIPLDTTGANAVLMVISEGGCDPATQGSSPYLIPTDSLNPNSMWRRVAGVGGPEPALQTTIWVISGATMQTGTNVTFQTANQGAASRPCNASFAVAVLNSPNMLPGNILVDVRTDDDTGTAVMTLAPGPLGGGLVLSVLGTDIGDCGGSCGFAINSGFQIIETRNQGAFNKGLGLAYSTNVPEGTDPQWSWTYNSGGSNQAQGINASLQERVFPSDTPTITTNTLPNATVGVAYSYTLAASAGGPPYTWTVTSGSLPAGLGLATSGALVGTPLASGTAYFTVRVTDAVGQTTSQAMTLIVDNAPILPITITTTSPLPAATVGSAYYYELAASGGVTPYIWTVTSGALPAGLTLSTAGVISGTPSANGTANFAVHLSDSAAPPDTTSAILSLPVNAAPVTLTITSTSPLPSGTVGTPYTYTFGAVGGTGPYTWALTAGTLPTGLTLSSAGVLGGSAITPTLKPLPRASTSLTVEVTDSVSATASGVFELTMNDTPPLIITPPSTPPTPTVGTPFTLTLTATGGVPPYTWGIDPDTVDLLPPGLTLSNGTISGTPTASGHFDVTIDVTDSLGRTSTYIVSFTVNDVSALTITTTSPLPLATAGTSYSVTFTAAGGTPPYTWTLGGVLPSGLSFLNGVLSGTPTTPTTTPASFTVTVTDNASKNVSRLFNLTVNPGTPATPVILTTSLASGTVGVAYSHTLAAIGGKPPYIWAVTSGSLPAGLALSPSGIIAGVPTAATTPQRAAVGQQAQQRAQTRTTQVTIGVTDTISQTAVQALALTITDPTAPGGAAGANGRIFGWCEDGNYQVLIGQGGGSSTNRFQRSFPNCTITVFYAGTNNTAPIFSDANGTVLGNPFTAAVSGRWAFYAAAGSSYDVRLSGGGIPAPFTLGSMNPTAGGSVGGSNLITGPMNTADFNFNAQQPSASPTLTAGVSATITMSPCPQGVAGTDAHHYLLVGGEAVLITGGTCTSGAASGTIIFTPTINHPSGFTVQSATAGCQEAVYAANPNGEIVFPRGTLNFYQTCYVDRSVLLRGQAEGPTTINVTSSGIAATAQNYFAFDVATDSAVSLRDLSIFAATPQVNGGGGIRLSGVANANQHSRIDHITTFQLWDDFYSLSAAKWVLNACTFLQTQHYGAFVDDAFNQDDGDAFISNNFWNNTVGALGTGPVLGNAGLYIQGGGGLRVIGNKINGFGVGLVLNPTKAVTGQLTIVGNGFDGYGTQGITLEATDGIGTWYSIVIDANYFAGWLPAAEGIRVDSPNINTGVISNNTFQRYGGLANLIGVRINNAKYFNVHDNVMVAMNIGIYNANNQNFTTIGKNVYNAVTSHIQNNGDPTTDMRLSGEPNDMLGFRPVGAEADQPTLVTSGSGNAGAAAIVQDTPRIGGATLSLATTGGASPADHTQAPAGGVGQIQFYAADGTNYSPVGTIQATSDQPAAPGNSPGTLYFWTTPQGSALPQNRMGLTSNGGLELGAPAGFGMGPGTVNVSNSFAVNGATFSGTLNVRNAAGTGTCTITVTGGIITASTCQ